MNFVCIEGKHSIFGKNSSVFINLIVKRKLAGHHSPIITYDSKYVSFCVSVRLRWGGFGMDSGPERMIRPVDGGGRLLPLR